MGHIAKCLYVSRSFYHTAASRPWSNHFRPEFQRFFQSGEKPVVFAVNRRSSDIFMHRGAFGLYMAGIFISFYGTYTMFQDTVKKQRSQ